MSDENQQPESGISQKSADLILAEKIRILIESETRLPDGRKIISEALARLHPDFHELVEFFYNRIIKRYDFQYQRTKDDPEVIVEDLIHKIAELKARKEGLKSSSSEIKLLDETGTEVSVEVPNIIVRFINNIPWFNQLSVRMQTAVLFLVGSVLMSAVAYFGQDWSVVKDLLSIFE